MPTQTIKNTDAKLPNSLAGQTGTTPSTLGTIDDDYKDMLIDATSTIELSESPDSVYHYFIASPMYAGFGDLASPERIFFLQDFIKMPKGLKDYMTSADTVELIFSIGREGGLNDSQISDSGVLVRELLYGKVFIKDFPIALSSKLGIDDIKAGEIANKIISKSFSPIIEDIKRIQRSKFPDKISQMQKESQPAGFSQKPQVSEGVKNMSLNRPGAGEARSAEMAQLGAKPKPVEPPRAPQGASPQNQAMSSQPQAMRPSVPASPSRPSTEIRTPVVDRPFDSISQSKPEPQQSIQPEPQKIPPQSPPLTPNKTTFRVPDLGPTSTAKQPPIIVKGEVGKSLEEELDKIANVIDLRGKDQG